MREALAKVEKKNPDLVIFSELILSGYPPQDLLERKAFIKDYREALDELIKISEKFPGIGILCGNIQATGRKTGKGLYNTAILIRNAKVLFEQRKSLLPTYDVFDEARYFDSTDRVELFEFHGEQLGITICEDAWNDPRLFPERLYSVNPVDILAKQGATILINISASPFGIGKEEIRYRLFRNHALKMKKPVILVNQVGANDELISDGRSMAFDGKGNLIKLFPTFREHVETIDLSMSYPPIEFVPMEKIASVYEALLLGIRDYTRKCGFKTVVLGLSGGIDSAVTCCLAKEALGSENILGVAMPSPYSSEASVEDARCLAQTLGIEFRIIPITSVYRSYLDSLGEHLAGMPEDITEENIQARIRGNILMALSNKFGYLPFSSGNKSELSVGYCTLYGDMSGGLSVLADVPKTMVYELAEYINRKSEVILRRIIEKPPSAELKPDQTDQDTLPPYDILDRILHLYLDQGCSKQEIIDQNISEETVEWVIEAVQKNEYKRRQAAPGLKVTSKAFGMGRRMPIASKYFR
jgi:NAD+ synthase (glutamine-hydrolysing)